VTLPKSAVSAALSRSPLAAKLDWISAVVLWTSFSASRSPERRAYFGGVERRAVRVHAVEPSAVDRVLKGMPERIEQHFRVIGVAGLREHEQLPRAGHRPITLGGQRGVVVGADCFVGQLQRGVETGTAPDGQHDAREVIAQGGGENGGRSGGKVHARHSEVGLTRHCNASASADATRFGPARHSASQEQPARGEVRLSIKQSVPTDTPAKARQALQKITNKEGKQCWGTLN
jgi:hypothetical protein